VEVKGFEPRQLPLFLEAPTHAIRTAESKHEAREIYHAVRQSSLYDRALGMYLVGDDVRSEGAEIGRIGAWARGWFENENVFMHMQHKFLLALLQAGLHEEFFENMKTCMVPFQDPAVYGRSPLENTSFIVSSRNPDPRRHGRGCQPRSSGTTAEVLHMMLLMSFGARPFRWENGSLLLEFDPVLAPWMFTSEACERTMHGADGAQHTLHFDADTYSALFLGHTMVTYHNPMRLPTFGEDRAVVKSMTLDYGDRVIEHNGSVLRGELAEDVRDGRITRILLDLADYATCPG
jgi:hypothetical protein